MRTIKPSWKHTSCLDNHSNLFSTNRIKTNYIVDTYSCKCGYDEFIIRDDNYIQYICKRCRNKTFLDAGLAWNDMNYLIKECKDSGLSIDFQLEYNLKTIDNKLMAVAMTKIPYDIDFIEKRILYKDLM